MKKLKKQPRNSRLCPRCKGRGWVGKANYHQGRRFEYKVRDYLRARGWTVYRSYASKGVIDLYAEKGTRKIGIQAKDRKTGAYLTPQEFGLLKTFKQCLSTDEAFYELHYWSNHKIKTLKIQGPIEPIHAYSLPHTRQIQWAYLFANDTWGDAKSLINRGILP